MSGTACVVGAGIAGSACARVLRGAGVHLTHVDRGRVVGGRMASRALPDRAGRRVDLGASYLTARDPRFAAQVDDWQQRGLARPWTDTFHTADATGLSGSKAGPVRWAAPSGLRSLVEDLAGDVVLQTHVERVGPGPTVDGTAYDAVVLALPDPQALAVLDPSLAEARTALEGRAWEPALAVAVGFAERMWDLDGVFVNDHPVLSWVADDGSRRGDAAPVLVAHTTPSYAAGHLPDPAAGGPGVVAALRALLDLAEPEWSYVQRWTFAKPVGTRDADFWLADGIGLCGDGWGASKVEAAWLSGTRLAEALVSG